MPTPADDAPPCSETLWHISAPTMVALAFAAQLQPGPPPLGPPGQKIVPYSHDCSDGPLSKYEPLMVGSVLAGGPAGAQTSVALQARSAFGHQLLPPLSGHCGLTVESHGAVREP